MTPMGGMDIGSLMPLIEQIMAAFTQGPGGMGVQAPQQQPFGMRDPQALKSMLEQKDQGAQVPHFRQLLGGAKDGVSDAQNPTQTPVGAQDSTLPPFGSLGPNTTTSDQDEERRLAKTEKKRSNVGGASTMR